MRKIFIFIAALFPLFSIAQQDSTVYWIRLSDSTYSAELRGKSGTRTDGLTCPGTWSHDQRVHEFYVKVTGSYDLYFDPSGHSSFTLDSDWSKTSGKFIPAPDITRFMDNLDDELRVVNIFLSNIPDSSGQGMIDPTGIAGDTLVKGDWLFINSDGKYAKSSATDSTKMPVIGIALDNVLPDSTVHVLWEGVFRRDADTWSKRGMVLYAGLTDGTPQEEPIAADGNVSQACALTMTTHIYRFRPEITLVRYEE